MEAERVLRYIGIARRAGRLAVGTPAVCDALRRRDGGAVFASNDISDGTRKRLLDKCAFYGARLIVLPVGGEELARRLGKTGSLAAVMIKDEGLSHSAESFAVEDTRADIE